MRYVIVYIILITILKLIITQIEPFKEVFDARSGFNANAKLEKNRIPCDKLVAGDLVMVEAFVDRYRVRRISHTQPHSRRQQKGESASYQVRFKLVDVMLLASAELIKTNTDNKEADKVTVHPVEITVSPPAANAPSSEAPPLSVVSLAEESNVSARGTSNPGRRVVLANGT